ncbi:MAG: mechanosensitive ion channel, partial [Acidobacteria bacterium]|nr:mechanosensitive ion channel [Acidobacteriota bacterium]
MRDDIPLSIIKSRASSTGARRSDQVNVTLSDSIDSDDKKNTHGRRKAVGPSRTGTGASDEVSVNFLGRMYARIINFNASLRYLIYIVPIGLILAVPVIVLAVLGHKEDIPVGSQVETVGDDEITHLGPSLYRLFLWIEIAWLTIWAGKLVAFFLPLIFMFLCGVVSSGTRKYATVLRNLQITLSLFLWALASYITFRELFKAAKNSGIDWVITLERILGATFAASAVYLGEKVVVQLIGISYHQRSFANRIHASKKDVRLLGCLLDASRSLFPMYCPEFEEEDYIINDAINLKFPGAKKGAGAVPQRLVQNVGRVGDKFTSVVGNIASEITGKQVLNPNSAHSVVTEALEKTKSAEALGKRIWMSFVVEGRESLLPEDIAEVLGPAHAEDAELAFATIDEDENGDISLDEMVRKVVAIGKERKAIVEGMKDISQALGAFDQVLLFFVLLIVIFIFLAFFQSSFITTLATAGTALLSLSFVFAVTTQEFLGSCIFLFVKHPYDVGDRVDILVDGLKTTLIVERISLLYTVFYRTDKMQIVQMPNIQINNLWIENQTRSGPMYQCITLDVSYDFTSLEDVELLRIEMEKFVRHPDNSRDFQPDLNINVVDVNNLLSMKLEILIRHKSNWHDGALKAERHSRFMCAIAEAMRKVPIYAVGRGLEPLGWPGNPSYMVTVSDQEAAEKREQAEKDKEALRMVPTGAGGHDPDILAAAAAAAPGGADAPGGEDWFNRSDRPPPQEGTRVSLDSRRSGLPTRGESTNKSGLRKAGETLSTTISHP